MSKKAKYEQTMYHRQPEQYYVKRGKRYYPVNDPGAYDGLGKGAWLVIVDKNCKSIRTQLNPKLAELDAALRYLEDGLTKAMSKACEMRPRTVAISQKEQRAWKVYREIMGTDMPRYFEYASCWEIATKGCEYIREIMLENNMDVEKIKAKYESKGKKTKTAIESLEV